MEQKQIKAYLKNKGKEDKENKKELFNKAYNKWQREKRRYELYIAYLNNLNNYIFPHKEEPKEQVKFTEKEGKKKKQTMKRWTI